MLFDWLVTGHVLDVNPAHAVRGPKYVVRKGKTPVLTAEEARELLDSIEIVRSTAGEDGETEEQPDLVGLRDSNLCFENGNLAVQVSYAAKPLAFTLVTFCCNQSNISVVIGKLSLRR